MKILALLLTTILLFSSCNTYFHLHETGVYTIKERKGAVTKFYEVKGTYEIISDTLKVNDKITINVLKIKPPKVLYASNPLVATAEQ